MTYPIRQPPDGDTAWGADVRAAIAGVNDHQTRLTTIEQLPNAKGDLMVATTDNTWSRLPVGADGLVLKASSGAATGLVWSTDIAGSGGSGLPVFNVKTDYGAVGDGTTNDTTAVQAAIAAANTAGGGIVFYPKGTYLCDDLITYTNITHQGTGAGSVLKQNTSTTTNRHLLSVNPFTGGTSDPTQNAHNITVRDLMLRGDVDTDSTFWEHWHLLNINAASDVLVENVDFVGWHGDGMYIGSGNSGHIERHNERVKVVNCRFDGLTKNNRNCISIIDGNDVQIVGCTFRRNSRSDMPGCIDMEPNSTDTFARIKNIRIQGCHAYDFQNSFVQYMLIDDVYTTPPGGILIENNTVEPTTTGDFLYLRHARQVGATSSRDDIIVKGNFIRNCRRPMWLYGMHGVQFHNNIFEGGDQSITIGYSERCRNIKYEGNVFAHQAAADAVLWQVANADYVQFIGNQLDQVGASGGGSGTVVNFLYPGAAATSTNIDLIDNIITGTLTTTISTLDSGHTTTASTNRARGNKTSLSINAAHFGTS